MSSRRTAQVSVVIPVGLRSSPIENLYAEYRSGLESLGVTYECIFVLDGPHSQAAADLARLQASGQELTVIQLTRRFGESAALMAGFERSHAPIIVTLPAYPQIEPQDLGRLLAPLQREEADVVIAHRYPRTGNRIEHLRRWAFHALLAQVTRLRFNDLGCGARAMRREVLEEVHPYGEQHRFLPVQADRLGFRVQEVKVRQSPRDRFTGRYRLREYAHQILDIFNIFFLVRFTKRPLRFFGSLGVVTFGCGMLLLAILVAERLLFYEPLGDRPLLLLGSLLAVLGMQLFALGLLGELLIFTHARDMKDYRIERIVQAAQISAPPAPMSTPVQEEARRRTEAAAPAAEVLVSNTAS